MPKSIQALRFDLLVCYDVDTTTSEGRRRLRQVAKACEGKGQRVQFSVFECSLTDELWLQLKTRLLDIINPKTDSLRIYRLAMPREKNMEVHGLDQYVDFGGPLTI